MDTLALILCVVLSAIAVIHMVWAAGSAWPYKDETSLAKAVVGSRGIENMPPRWASLLVSLCLFGAGLWALALRGIGPIQVPQMVQFLGGLALTAVFGLRGVLGVFPAFEKMAPEQPFLRLNRRVYSPLCVLIGLGFALLTIAIPNWGWRFSA